MFAGGVRAGDTAALPKGNGVVLHSIATCPPAASRAEHAVAVDHGEGGLVGECLDVAEPEAAPADGDYVRGADADLLKQRSESSPIHLDHIKVNRRRRY